jgi:hypothetical protein
MKHILIAMLAVVLLGLGGCVNVEKHEEHHARRGPPPHAPAHGYRHQQHQVNMRYDAHLGVYVVIGHPDHYFSDGHYFRRAGSHWERCGNWKKGKWKSIELAMVPTPLARHYHAKGPKRGKGHGHGPAKHAD